ncbi:delta-60 repeat domain-containing protein [Nocardia sp. alder85J]|uniref:delta-60 repeat domain-containing protein n=1 Tax=Nocardia sp. alder85J TaxID=2862949 RepID=UPI001CD573B5|nr:delta-60 repeat domain-containing protein [Nocardia sp. alder85J]MCX4091680.1 delta-60 repeat domain-containing protein [Nocardia sp. alder85J]
MLGARQVPVRVPRWRVGMGVTALAALTACSPAHAAAAGTLDNAFGAHGKVWSSVGTDSRARAVAVQPDGRIVAAGAVHDAVEGDNFAVVRYLPDGTEDPTFGVKGIVSTDFDGKSDVAAAVVVQPDGRIVAVGTSHGTATGDNIAVARYNSDGTLDPNFGDGGRVSTDLGTQADHGNAAALQPDGKLIVAGSTRDVAGSDDFVLIRYTTDGKPDPGFGSAGVVATDFAGKADTANAVVVQPDGRILAVGTSHGTTTGDNIAVARYNPDGTPDPSFGDGGRVSTDLGTKADHGNAVALQPDGRILVAGSTHDTVQGDNFVLIRYTTDGKLDPGFGKSGVVATDFGGAADVANAVGIESGGKIVVAGTSHGADDSDRIAVARYTRDGTLDNGFGRAGQATTEFGKKADQGRAIAVQADGRIVIAGVTHDPALGDSFALVRYRA